MPLNTRAAMLGLLTLTGIGLVPSVAAAAGSCPLSAPKSAIKHVVFMQFDNLHLERDQPNVPSDLEQMPALSSFLTANGVLSGNDHTVQISHTANGFVTTQSGLYSDRLGLIGSNSFLRYNTDGSTSSVSDFVYWTDPVSAGSEVPVLLDDTGKNAPAPWVPYTRAGCDVGYAGIADTVLENTGLDFLTVFGPGSDEANEAAANPSLASTDYIGVAIHCAKGSALCSTPLASPDLLPDEPGGYTGYSALFGHKNALPQLGAKLPLTDLNGAVISDENGNPGFPGFDGMLPATSLTYAAIMLEAGVPVVNVYGSDVHDAHDGHGKTLGPLGPGTAAYEAQLRAFDAGFAAFFARLKQDGIDQTNTLFVFTTDEEDHFVGSKPSPANCDGVHVECTYANIGEIDADLSRLVADQRGNKTPFKVHSDSAPVISISGNPAQTDPATRQLEQDFLALKVPNTITGQTVPLAAAMVDQVGMGFIHLRSTDTPRLPSFIYYQDQNFFGFSSGQTTSCSTGTACVEEETGFAYNHGDFQDDIRTTWVGMAGPGVRKLGTAQTIWTDHVDVRPTMLALLGLGDDYTHDGRAILEFMTPQAMPTKVAANRDLLIQLGSVYKQITAPFGELGLLTLKASTKAIGSNEAEYQAIENRIRSLTATRDRLAGQIKTVLDDAVFKNDVDARATVALIAEANIFRIEAFAQLQ
jgi:hypothetical protein